MRILIVGGGKVGGYLAMRLLEQNHNVTLIEARADIVARLGRDLPRQVVVFGSGTDPDVLEAAGIHQADVVAAVTGTDETNLVVTSLARFAFQAPRTIGRVNNPRNAWLFIPEMGVDAAMNQADVVARMIVEQVAQD